MCKKRNTELSERMHLPEGSAVWSQSHILIVDDEPESVGPLRDMLSEWSYQVMFLNSAHEALAAIKEQSFDIVISDLIMPEMDGIELLRTARAVDPNLICIIMTGYATVQMAIEALKIGVFDFVLKPFDFKMLRFTLSRASEVRNLRKSEEIYRSIVEDYQTEFICRFRPDGTLTFANQAFCRYVGKANEKVIGRNFLRFAPPEDRKYLMKQHSSLSVMNPVTSYQTRVLRPDGATGWQEWTCRAIFNRQGNIAEIQSIGRDISLKVETEEILALKEMAIANSINSIAISNCEGKLTYVNNAFLRLWKYENDVDILGRHATSFWHTEEEAEKVIQLIREKGSWIGELTARRKDGETFDVHLVASMFMHKVTHSSYIIASFVDITERRLSEKSLQKKEEELKNRVKELEEFYEIAVGRELRMKQLKEDMEKMERELKKYKGG